MCRRQDTELGFIFMHEVDKAVGQLINILVVFRSALNDFVVNIGDVTHVVHIVSNGTQPAVHHIEHHHHPRMSEMAIVIYRHAAHIHADLARRHGLKCLFFAR